MHYICSTFGSSGDVFPMLGLALELRQRGHDVTLATNPHYAGLAAEYNVPFEALGTEADFQACISHPDLWTPRKAFGHVFGFLKTGLKRQYEIHAERAAQGPVAGITNCFGFGAFNARDKLGIPVITLHCQPAVLWSDIQPPSIAGLFGPRWLKSWMYGLAERYVIDPIVCKFLNPWRTELGLPPAQRITRWWHSPSGVICMFPEWFAPPQADWPQPLRQTDFPLWNHQSSAGLSADVAAFLDAGSPPLVFTPGSTNLHGQGFFRAAVESCQTLGRRGILLTEYPDQLPRPLPPTVAHFAYVPLDLLLGRAAAFIHHGGIGSTSQALLAGIPQVLMPLAHDQFDNGARVEQQHLGGWIAAPKFTSARLTPMLKRLLESSQVRAACQQVRERLAPRDGLTRSAAAAEELVEMARRATGERHGASVPST